MRAEEHRIVYSLEDDYWWFKAKRRFALKVVKDLIRGQNPQGLRLLDAGCGTGAISLELQKILSCTSMEKYPQALKFCRQRKVRNLINADLEKPPFKKESFDIILAFDVLEHLSRDDVAVKELLRLLRQSGIVVVHVPAFMFLWSEHDQAVSHKRRYTLSGLKRLMEESGFKVVSIRYRLSAFFILGILRKCLLKLKRAMHKDKPISAFRPKLGVLLNNLFYSLVAAEDSFLSFFSMPFGLSIICTVRKV